MNLRMLLFVGLALAGTGLVQAQKAPYKVVFDLTSRDSLDQKAVMRWVHEVTEADPSAQVEVVMYGKGYELVMPGKIRFHRAGEGGGPESQRDVQGLPGGAEKQHGGPERHPQ